MQTRIKIRLMRGEFIDEVILRVPAPWRWSPTMQYGSSNVPALAAVQCINHSKGDYFFQTNDLLDLLTESVDDDE